MATNTNCNPDFLNGRYIINKQIGEGSEGNIFLAHDTNDNLDNLYNKIYLVFFFFLFYNQTGKS